MSRKEATGLTVFFLIAFGIPWAGWTVLRDQGLPYWLLPIFCSIAGFAASYAEGGVEGLRKFCQRTLHLGGTVKYILLAALIPLMLGLLYLVITGASFDSFQPALKSGLGITLALALVTGPLAEKFGWRGYLQTKLISYMRPIWVALTIGVIWCLWHLPLFYSSVFGTLQSALGFVAFCITWSIFLVYLVPRANGSIWPAVFLHWAVNTHATILGALFPALDGSQLPGGSNTTLLYALAAIVFVALYWRFFTSVQHPDATSNNSFKPNPLRGSA